jgi:7-cyano-7-deazaguanine synthase
MKTVVMLSGGVDATVLLADVVKLGHDCTPVIFDYRQIHRREVESAVTVADHYGLTTRIVALA